MYAFRITCWALIFIFRLRFPPGISIATIHPVGSPCKLAWLRFQVRLRLSLFSRRPCFLGFDNGSLFMYGKIILSQENSENTIYMSRVKGISSYFLNIYINGSRNSTAILTHKLRCIEFIFLLRF